MTNTDIAAPALTAPSIGLPSRRLTNFLGFSACVLMLSFGYYLQYVEQLEPCPLCILQRLAIFVTGCVFLVAAIHNPQPRGGRLYGLLLALTIGTGAAISARHIWLQYFVDADKLSCGMGLDYMLEAFSPFETLTLILRGTGDCTRIDWSFLGLSIPGWTLVCFLCLGLVGVTRNAMSR
jgi:disulfide bond formation protein DsbB